MKSFFKTFFASFLGSAMLLIVLIILLFSSIISSIASSEQTVKVKPKSILYMTLDYEIPERSNENDLGLVFNGSSFKTTDNAGMNDSLNNIKAAAIDPNISGIFIELSSLGISAASANIEEAIAMNGGVDFILSTGDTIAHGGTYKWWKQLGGASWIQRYMYADVLGNHDWMTSAGTYVENGASNIFFGANHNNPKNGYAGQENICYYFY